MRWVCDVMWSLQTRIEKLYLYQISCSNLKSPNFYVLWSKLAYILLFQTLSVKKFLAAMFAATRPTLWLFVIRLCLLFNVVLLVSRLPALLSAVYRPVASWTSLRPPQVLLKEFSFPSWINICYLKSSTWILSGTSGRRARFSFFLEDETN